MSPSPRLLIFDHALTGHEGHHFDYSRSVIESASRAGLQPELICSEAFLGDQLATATVVGRYPERRSGTSLNAARTMLKRSPAVLRRLIFRGTKLFPPLAERSAPDRRFGLNFCRLAAAAALGPADHVLLHTASKPEFLGLAEAIAANLHGPGHFHLILRYDGDSDYRSAFAALDGMRDQIHLWTDTEPLAAQYRELGCTSIGVLPIPHLALGDMTEQHSPRGALTLAFLGGARKDKGFHSLPDLIEELSASGTQSVEVRFLVQATYASSRHEALMEETTRRLRSFPPNLVELIERPLNTIAFQAALAATDLLLLPYEPETYRRRSSGLLVQAMVAGIPTVVPADTWLSAEAPAAAHVVFGRDVPLIQAVRRAIDHHDVLLTEAHFARASAAKKHDASELIYRLLAA